MKISFVKQHEAVCDAIIICVDDSLELTNSQQELDAKYGGIISDAIKAQGVVCKKFGSTKTFTVKSENKLLHIILVCAGSKDELKSNKFVDLGGIIFKRIKCSNFTTSEMKIDWDVSSCCKAEIASSIAFGIELASYEFSKYITKKKCKDTAPESFIVVLDDINQAQRMYDSHSAVASGVFLARDCINEPPNILYPESYAKIIMSNLSNVGVKVEILGEREMHNLGMNALLGVGQGSARESKLVVMEYRGADDESSAPIAFVGKGVTFDTGGISIKPSLNMSEMKYDMAGSAAVLGVMKTLAMRKAKVNAVGVVGLVENMPGGNAQRPGDIVKTMSGKTVEILDTDAEGRLVLSDALWFTQDKFKPLCMIDLATLTGAITIALGSSYAGCFSNNDDLVERLIRASEKTDEKLWRMPLCDDYEKMIKSDVADIANLGNPRGAAGSSTAAQFLKSFVNDVPWVHIDIAGVASRKADGLICPKGAVGFGVRLLNQFVKDYYETN